MDCLINSANENDKLVKSPKSAKLISRSVTSRDWKEEVNKDNFPDGNAPIPIPIYILSD